MLILNPGEVQYCCLSHQGKPLNGLNYYDHLFVQVRYYAQDQFQNAIRQCRELLEVKTSVLSIVVKESNGFTLWSEKEDVQLLKEQKSPTVVQKSTPTNKPKATIKYRGVEISPQTQNLPTFPAAAKSELKYRGQSCL